MEVKHLLGSFSTGHHGLTTMHTDDVRHIPDRIENMMQDALAAARMENDIYNFINVGVFDQQKAKEDGTIHRCISQICLFNRESQNNEIQMLVDDGIILKRAIPGELLAENFPCKDSGPVFCMLEERREKFERGSRNVRCGGQKKWLPKSTDMDTGFRFPGSGGLHPPGICCYRRSLLPLI